MPKPRSPESQQKVKKTKSKPVETIPDVVVPDVVVPGVVVEIVPQQEPSSHQEPTLEDVKEDHHQLQVPLVPNKTYPLKIEEILTICKKDAADVKQSLKKCRNSYKRIFEEYKNNMSSKDYSIVKSGLYYLYEFSTFNSIPKENAEWVLGIFEIPKSHIVSYTSKDILKRIAKERGLTYSNKKSDVLVEEIRGVIDKSC